MTVEEYTKQVKASQCDRINRMLELLKTSDADFKITYKCNKTRAQLEYPPNRRYIVPYEYCTELATWIGNYRVYEIDGRFVGPKDRPILSLDEAMQIAKGNGYV